MSETQAYTKTELETLLQSVTVAAMAGVLSSDAVWIDKPGEGNKPEPYARVMVGNRVRTGIDDTSWVIPAAGATPAQRFTTRERIVSASIDLFGPDAMDHGQTFVDQLDLSEIRELFWAVEVGLVGGVTGPTEFQYTDDMQRKTGGRVGLSLFVSETTVTSSEARPANYIETVELVNPDYGDPQLITIGGS